MLGTVRLLLGRVLTAIAMRPSLRQARSIACRSNPQLTGTRPRY
jgi:hypothetical protein